MARRKDEAHGGGHGWFVTFADLMGLLVSFFVMLVAFSNQDAKKDAGRRRLHAGSVWCAERCSLFRRGRKRFVAAPSPTSRMQLVSGLKNSSVTPTPDEHGKDATRGQAFAMVVASLRRSLEAMPELAEPPSTSCSRKQSGVSTLTLSIRMVVQCFPKALAHPTSAPGNSSRLSLVLSEAPLTVLLLPVTPPLRAL